jgi:Ca2+-binding RTX toxin-like protein
MSGEIRKSAIALHAAFKDGTAPFSPENHEDAGSTIDALLSFIPFTKSVVSGDAMVNAARKAATRTEEELKKYDEDFSPVMPSSAVATPPGQKYTGSIPQPYVPPSKPVMRDPLAIDMNGDGKISTVRIQQGVHFDLDSNGFAESTAWVGPQDGILVLDKNNNGIIDDGTELFGPTPIAGSFVNGFEALRGLDSNDDGYIDSLDSMYKDLEVWVDSNSDGRSDANELVGLGLAGIKSISLRYNTDGRTDENSVIHGQVGEILKNGSSAVIDSLLLPVDKVDTVPTTIHNGDEIFISSEIAGLPDVKGYGTAFSLHQKMSLDTTRQLAGLVQKFVTEVDVAKRKAITTQIINSWFDQAVVDEYLTVDGVNARHLGVMKTLWGESNDGATPVPLAAAIEAQYNAFFASVYSQLMSSSHTGFYVSLIKFQQIGTVWTADFEALNSYFVDLVGQQDSTVLTKYQDVSDTLAGFSEMYGQLGGGLVAKFNTSLARRLSDAEGVPENYKVLVLQHLLAGSDSLQGSSANDSINGFAGDDIILGGDGDDVIYGGLGSDNLSGERGDDIISGGSGINTLHGGDGNDVIFGDGYDDVLYGDDGNDYLKGGAGISRIYGGAGNDILMAEGGGVLSGGDGADIYEFLKSDASIIIQNDDTDNGRADAIILDDLTIEEVVITRKSNNLVIISKETHSSVTVLNFFDEDENHLGAGAIAKIVFADLTELSSESLRSIVGSPTAFDDYLQMIVGLGTIDGLAGDDEIHGSKSSDVIKGGLGRDLIFGGSGNDTISGDEGNDTLNGEDGDDLIDGGLGEYDLLYGGSGNDTLISRSTSGAIFGGEGDDTLRALAGSLLGEGGNDTLTIVSGDLVGGDGDDTYIYHEADEQVYIHDFSSINGDRLFLSGLAIADITISRLYNSLLFTNKITGSQLTIDQYFSASAESPAWSHFQEIVFSDGTTLSKGQIELIVSSGTDGADYLIGNGNADDISGAGGNDLIYGRGGDDRLAGGAGDDSVFGDDGNDTLIGNEGNDYLYGGMGNDLLIADLGTDTLSGNEGDDTYVVNLASRLSIINDYDEALNKVGILQFGEGINPSDIAFRRFGNSPNLYLYHNDQTVIVSDYFSSDASKITNIKFANGVIWDRLEIAQRLKQSTSGDDHIYGDDNSDFFDGGDGNDDINGYAGDDYLVGGHGDDILNGSDGDDTLYGGEGDDTLIGGSGNNTFDGDAGSDVYNSLNGANDVYVLSSHSGKDYAYNLPGKINITLKDATIQDLNFTKSYGSLIISLPSGASLQLQGFFNANGAVGNIQINDFKSGSKLYDAASLAPLSLLGASSDDDLIGFAGNDYISGAGGADKIDGAEGNDVLEGGLGNDTVTGNVGNDTYVFGRQMGIDTIDEYDDISAINTLRFKDAASQDVIAYKLDSMHLVLRIKDTLDRVVIKNYFTSDEVSKGKVYNRKIDRVEFSDGVVWSENEIQSALALPVDSNHFPIVPNSIPKMFATVGEYFSYRIPTGLASDPDGDKIFYSITGFNHQDLPTWLSFDPLTNTLYGTPSALDIGTPRIELWAEDSYAWTSGLDLNLKVGYPNTAPSSAEKILSQTAIEGNLFNYSVPANAFSDPNAGDVLTYSATLADGRKLPSWLTFDPKFASFFGAPPVGSLDSLLISVTVTDSGGLTASQQFSISVAVEDKILNGTSRGETLIGGSGNDSINGAAGDDTLRGNDGNDRLDGGAGNDSMVGGRGNDLYIVNSASDKTLEDLDQGIDTVESSVTWSLAANIENLTLTGTAIINATGNDLVNNLSGNSGANTLLAGGGDDRLDGGAGADKMSGGSGNDVYVIDNSGDIITEVVNEGIDSVESSITYSLTVNVENLYLTGSNSVNGTGNSLDNKIYGNVASNTLTGGAGNDFLDGGSGADKMIGGAGDDTYVVDNTSDAYTEVAGQGLDGVISSVTLTLTANVENLTLIGAAAVNGTGNELNNFIVGNAAANILTGGAGNDKLEGMAGKDTMIGGAGNDTYILSRGYGLDTILDSDSTTGNSDTLQFISDVSYDQLWFKQVSGTKDLEVSIIGTSDAALLKDWYSSSANHVEKFLSSGGKALADTQIQNLVNAMASFSPPPMGQLTMDENVRASLAPILASSWK